MTDHIHNTECTKLGHPCHGRGVPCKKSHPTQPDLNCAKLAGHGPNHEGWGNAMKRIEWTTEATA